MSHDAYSFSKCLESFFFVLQNWLSCVRRSRWWRAGRRRRRFGNLSSRQVLERKNISASLFIKLIKLRTLIIIQFRASMSLILYIEYILARMNEWDTRDVEMRGGRVEKNHNFFPITKHLVILNGTFFLLECLSCAFNDISKNESHSHEKRQQPPHRQTIIM